MKNRAGISFPLLLSLLLTSCNRDLTDGSAGLSPETYPQNAGKPTGREVINRILRFSSFLDRPYAVFYKTGADLLETEYTLEETCTVVSFPSLTVTPWADTLIEAQFSAEERKEILDSMDLIRYPEQMLDYLERKGLFCRMAFPDALDSSISRKLIDWGNSQNPPVWIKSNRWVLTAEGPNSGGCSPVIAAGKQIKNLGFLLRSKKSQQKKQLSGAIQSGLTEDQLILVLTDIPDLVFTRTQCTDQ